MAGLVVWPAIVAIKGDTRSCLLEPVLHHFVVYMLDRQSLELSEITREPLGRQSESYPTTIVSDFTLEA